MPGSVASGVRESGGRENSPTPRPDGLFAKVVVSTTPPVLLPSWEKASKNLAGALGSPVSPPARMGLACLFQN